MFFFFLAQIPSAFASRVDSEALSVSPPGGGCKYPLACHHGNLISCNYHRLSFLPSFLLICPCPTHRAFRWCARPPNQTPPLQESRAVAVATQWRKAALPSHRSKVPSRRSESGSDHLLLVCRAWGSVESFRVRPSLQAASSSFERHRGRVHNRGNGAEVTCHMSDAGSVPALAPNSQI